MMTNQSLAQMMTETIVFFALMALDSNWHTSENKYASFLLTDFIAFQMCLNVLIFQSVLANCHFLNYCQHTVVLIESGVRIMLESKSAYFHLPQSVNVHTALFVDIKNS